MQVLGVGNGRWDEEIEERERARAGAVARLCRAATAPGIVRYVNGANYGPEGELAATGRIHRGETQRVATKETK